MDPNPPDPATGVFRPLRTTKSAASVGPTETEACDMPDAAKVFRFMNETMGDDAAMPREDINTGLFRSFPKGQTPNPPLGAPM